MIEAIFKEDVQLYEEALRREGGALSEGDGFIINGYSSRAQDLRDNDGAVVVEIQDDDGEADRDTRKPTIAIVTEFGTTLLTWRQARALAAAIATVESTARVG